jgi:hypothetical protein
MFFLQYSRFEYLLSVAQSTNDLLMGAWAPGIARP